MSVMSGWAPWKPMELTAIAGKSAWSMIRQDSSAQILQLKICRVSVPEQSGKPPSGLLDQTEIASALENAASVCHVLL